MDDEPTVNISGGADGGGAHAEFTPGDAETHAEAVVDRLGELFWQKTYGGQDALECLVRTILSQNTSDVASQPAHDALMDRYAGPDTDLAIELAHAEHGELADTIRSAGLYNQKASSIIDCAERIVDEYGSTDAFDGWVKTQDPATVRTELLDFSGVGPKTADCVLLFAGSRAGVFPVDTHVHRIYRRLGIAPPDADHEEVRAVLEEQVPIEKCGFGHTASIQFGREYCSAGKPICVDDPDACPLFDLCARVGVDIASGDVVDPAEAPAESSGTDGA